MAATINDVARVAGVSKGTVSKFLNGGHYVSMDNNPAAGQHRRRAEA